MHTRIAFGQALRMVRKSKGVSQEQLAEVSSRTYVSTLERGLQSPTLEKIEQLATQLGVHPLTLIAETFCIRDSKSASELLRKVSEELQQLPPRSANESEG